MEQLNTSISKLYTISWPIRYVMIYMKEIRNQGEKIHSEFELSDMIQSKYEVL